MDSDRWLAVVAAIATPIATVAVAWRQFRKNGMSSEEVKAILEAAMADQEGKQKIVEERNRAVTMLEIVTRERERIERDRDEMEDRLRQCRNRADDLEEQLRRKQPSRR